MTADHPNSLPCVCAWCRRVREPNGSLWAAAGPPPAAPHTHGICPACVDVLLRDILPGGAKNPN